MPSWREICEREVRSRLLKEDNGSRTRRPSGLARGSRAGEIAV